ncbi:MAG TPA: hypothetical protein VFH54_06155 [Mycobacteriales bacterium]|nr:hypothetical protein [Mycobacteriales bacterium]
MNILVDGTSYPWDGSKLHVVEAMAMAEYAELSPEEWAEHVKNITDFVQSKDVAKFKAMQCLVWMLRRRAGETVGLVADTDFDLAQLDIELSEAERAELAEKIAAAQAEAAGKPTPKPRKARPTAAA